MLKTKLLLLRRKMKTDSQSLNQLTDIFLQRWGIKLNTYKDEFHRTDMWFEWNGTTKDVEVKRRRFNSSKYPTTIVNEDKFKELLKNKACLVVMFDDCWFVCKNVAKAYLKTTPMYARHTTDFGGNWEWANKVELDLTKFTRYEY